MHFIYTWATVPKLSKKLFIPAAHLRKISQQPIRNQTKLKTPNSRKNKIENKNSKYETEKHKMKKKIETLKPISKTQTKSRKRFTKSKKQRDKMFINPKRDKKKAEETKIQNIYFKAAIRQDGCPDPI